VKRGRLVTNHREEGGKFGLCESKGGKGTYHPVITSWGSKSRTQEGKRKYVGRGGNVQGSHRLTPLREGEEKDSFYHLNERRRG